MRRKFEMDKSLLLDFESQGERYTLFLNWITSKFIQTAFLFLKYQEVYVTRTFLLLSLSFGWGIDLLLDSFQIIWLVHASKFAGRWKKVVRNYSRFNVYFQHWSSVIFIMWFIPLIIDSYWRTFFCKETKKIKELLKNIRFQHCV